MTRTLLAELPDWPRFLSRHEAARYLGVSVDVFDDEVRAGTWPAGMRRGAKGGLLTWDKRLLDSMADSRSGIAPGASAATDAVAEVRTDPASLAWETRLNATPHRNRP